MMFTQILLNFVFIHSIKIDFFGKNIKTEEHISDSLKAHNNNFNNEKELIEISNYERINPQDSNYFYLPIFSSSDIHGHFYEEELEVKNIDYSHGGLDYMAKYANIIREEFNNNVLYLDAGDLYQGGTESTITNGEIILDYLNLINCDAITMGNHEYDLDRTNLEKKVKDGKFPLLTTNVYDSINKTKKAFGENHFTSKVFSFNIPKKNEIGKEDEVKIGVVGLSFKMLDNQISGEGYEGIEFLDYKEELVAEANKLRRENGVNAVVLLSHIGIGCGQGNNLTLNLYKATDEQEECNNDSDIYKLIYEIDEGTIDAVITGHSHREVHHFIRNIPVISPIYCGLYANIIYLAFDRNNYYKLARNKIRIEGPLPICKQIFEKSLNCEFMKASKISDYLPLVNYSFHGVKIEKDSILQPIHNKYDKNYSIYNEKVCSIIGTEDTLTIEKNGSFYLGNMMADMQKLVTGADISIVSYGNLRTTWNPGRIPRFKVQDLLPFGNHLCSFIMNGEEVKKMINIIQTGRKKYYITSGLKQLLVKNKNGDFYLSDIKLFDGFQEFDIISEHEYLIAANNFLIEKGGDDFNKVLSWYQPKNLNCSYGPDLDLFETYLKNQKIIEVSKYLDEENPRIRFIE